MSLSSFRAFVARLRGDTRGLSAAEFGLIMPVLLLLAVGMADFGRLLLLTQKLQNGAFILADLAGRGNTISASQVDNMFLALEDLISPFEFADSGRAIVTSVSGTDSGDPVVNWQRSGAGTLDATSEIGGVGGDAIIPSHLNLASGETIIATEVVYSFEPLFGLTTTAHTMRKSAFIKPRLGSLDTLSP